MPLARLAIAGVRAAKFPKYGWDAMFVLGGGVKGGKVYGRWPGLAPAKLIDGDLAVTTDYRAVIAEILRALCGVRDTAAIFPGVAAQTSHK